MPCHISGCSRLYIDHEPYAHMDSSQLAREAAEMLKAEYRQWPHIHLKDSGPISVDNRRNQITRLALSCLAMCAACAIVAITFHAILIPSLLASAVLIATGGFALRVWRRQASKVDQLKALADQINAGQFRGLRSKIKPLLQEQFYTPSHPLYLNPNSSPFQDWVEARVDRSHANGGIHFEGYVGMAMLIDAFDSIRDVNDEKQFKVLRQDITIGLKLAKMRRIDVNTPGEKAFGYIVLHRPLQEVKAIIQQAR
ncbi:MAG: hypothetical protein LLG04_02325 [Parachlamydia sp.]|nr:hypothetical protein [Parachlamydia sp.]